MNSKRLEMTSSRHVDFGVYGSDTRFMFNDPMGITYNRESGL